MCLIQSSLEKMIEKLLSGLEAEEWGGNTAGISWSWGKDCTGLFSSPWLLGNLGSVQ